LFDTAKLFTSFSTIVINEKTYLKIQYSLKSFKEKSAHDSLPSIIIAQSLRKTKRRLLSSTSILATFYARRWSVRVNIPEFLFSCDKKKKEL